MISVRAYIPDDYDSIRAIYQATDAFGGQFDEDRDSADRLNKQIGHDKQSILVAEEGINIIGTVSILQDKRFAWLVRFAVVTEEASSALLAEASKILKQKGHSQVLVYAPAGDSKFIIRYGNLRFKQGKHNYASFWLPLA